MFINNNSRFCYKANKKYYLETRLKEYKYKQETENYIDEDLESDIYSNNETESDTNNNE